jgi:hypothetical protein
MWPKTRKQNPQNNSYTSLFVNPAQLQTCLQLPSMLHTDNNTPQHTGCATACCGL